MTPGKVKIGKEYRFFARPWSTVVSSAGTAAGSVVVFSVFSAVSIAGSFQPAVFCGPLDRYCGAIDPSRPDPAQANSAMS